MCSGATAQGRFWSPLERQAVGCGSGAGRESLGRVCSCVAPEAAQGCALIRVGAPGGSGVFWEQS